MSALLDALKTLAPHLALDLAATYVIVQVIFLRLYPRREYGFTYWLLNLITFSVAHTLSGVRVEMGLSLGLFAVFGILRYRTEAMRIRDLTYLFVIIGLAMLNGVARGHHALAHVALVNVVVTAAVALLELRRTADHEDAVSVRYDRIDLLPASRRAELLADLTQRLGVPCHGVSVERVDLMHDSAELMVTFRVAPADAVVPAARPVAEAKSAAETNPGEGAHA